MDIPRKLSSLGSPGTLLFHHNWLLTFQDSTGTTKSRLNKRKKNYTNHKNLENYQLPFHDVKRMNQAVLDNTFAVSCIHVPLPMYHTSKCQCFSTTGLQSSSSWATAWPLSKGWARSSFQATAFGICACKAGSCVPSLQIQMGHSLTLSYVDPFTAVPDVSWILA